MARLQAWAAERDHSLVDLAIAWVLSHPAVTVCLCGPSRPIRLTTTCGAPGWRLSPEERSEVSALID